MVYGGANRDYLFAPMSHVQSGKTSNRKRHSSRRRVMKRKQQHDCKTRKSTVCENRFSQTDFSGV